MTLSVLRPSTLFCASCTAKILFKSPDCQASRSVRLLGRLQQLTDVHTQRIRHPLQVIERHIRLASLHRADVGAVDSRVLPQLLLRPPGSLSQPADVGCKTEAGDRRHPVSLRQPFIRIYTLYLAF